MQVQQYNQLFNRTEQIPLKVKWSSDTSDEQADINSNESCTLNKSFIEPVSTFVTANRPASGLSNQMKTRPRTQSPRLLSQAQTFQYTNNKTTYSTRPQRNEDMFSSISFQETNQSRLLLKDRYSQHKSDDDDSGEEQV